MKALFDQRSRAAACWRGGRVATDSIPPSPPENSGAPCAYLLLYSIDALGTDSGIHQAQVGRVKQLIRSTRDFWIFHSVFWALAAVALFLYGLTYGHVWVAIVRNLYNPLVGFAYSYLIRVFYENRFPAGLTKRLLLIAGLSLLGAIASALIVNPITFGMLGYKLGDMPLHSLLQDGLYYVLLYLLWSLLYLQLTGRSLTSSSRVTSAVESINVTKGNQVFKLDPANVFCIKASGDYVELCTSGESYLKHGTISFYERALGKGPFVRVHRSTIVNRDKIVSVAGPTKGQYRIKLQSGEEIRSSRRYQEVVESLAPEAL